MPSDFTGTIERSGTIRTIKPALYRNPTLYAFVISCSFSERAYRAVVMVLLYFFCGTLLVLLVLLVVIFCNACCDRVFAAPLISDPAHLGSSMPPPNN